MAADSNTKTTPDQNVTHARDYAGFINLLKWTVVIVAIISAVVIYIISN